MISKYIINNKYKSNQTYSVYRSRIVRYSQTEERNNKGTDTAT